MLDRLRTRAMAWLRARAPWVDHPRVKSAVWFLVAVKDEVQRDETTVWAGALAYRFFLALFPFLIFVAAASGFVAGLVGIEDPTADMIELFARVLPAEASRVIGGEVGGVIESRNAGLLSIGLVAAIWAASSGMGALMRAMNKAYNIEESRPLWKKYPVAVGLTLLGGTFIIAATVLFFTGQFFLTDIFGWLGIEGGWPITLAAWSRWPFIGLMLLAGVSFIYWASPNAKVSFRRVLPGAGLFVVVWLLMTLGFSLYVANFGNYDATYGTLGGVVVLLIYMYVSSLLLLVGAEVNAVVLERVDPAHMRQERAAKHAEAAEQAGK